MCSLSFVASIGGCIVCKDSSNEAEDDDNSAGQDCLVYPADDPHKFSNVSDSSLIGGSVHNHSDKFNFNTYCNNSDVSSVHCNSQG